jgi:predicted NBD/HSP70 family sugar kinase
MRKHKPLLMPGGQLGQRSETVRRANLSTVLRVLHEEGPRSRSDLVARTGLTRSAIRALIGELTAIGLVSEERAQSQGAPGRPSPVVRSNPDGAVVLALEIAVDSLAVATVGLGGQLHDVVRVDRARGRFSVDETIDDLVELCRLVRARPPASTSLIGVGVAVVGIVRRSDGFVSLAPNLGWHDIPLGERLTAALGTDLPVFVANEADLGALAEHRRGAAVGAADVVFISGEVGVGGGIIVDGRPLTGVAGFGGEVGHMPVNPNGVACRCGSVGCWETEIGEGALLLRAGRPPTGGRAEVDAVMRDAAQGEPATLSALDTVGRWLGYGLASLVNVFNPQLVVLGGRYERMYPYTIGTIRAQLDRLALAGAGSTVTVVPATLGMDAPLLGAAELAFEPLMNDPAAWAPHPARDEGRSARSA